MSKIGILEDRPAELATTKSIIARNLNDPKWEVIEVPLLPTAILVVKWLAQQEVNVLVADQVLSDASRQRAVSYQGTDVISEVRSHLPDMPIYMITAFPDNPDVEPNLGRMEEMVPRGQLGRLAPVLVPRMKRAGETFERRHRESLSRLSELSQKKATATLSKPEQKELKSLQMSLSLADTTEARSQLLPKLEQEVEKLRVLQTEATKLLRRQSAKR